jgi:hypothetical protein
LRPVLADGMEVAGAFGFVVRRVFGAVVALEVFLLASGPRAPVFTGAVVPGLVVVVLGTVVGAARGSDMGLLGSCFPAEVDAAHEAVTSAAITSRTPSRHRACRTTGPSQRPRVHRLTQGCRAGVGVPHGPDRPDVGEALSRNTISAVPLAGDRITLGARVLRPPPEVPERSGSGASGRVESQIVRSSP